jgi:RNA polymerase sigma-70 factor (ECF subfamily)
MVLALLIPAYNFIPGDGTMSRTADKEANLTFQTYKDWDLIKAFGRGEALAAEELVGRYYQKVVNACYQQLTSWDDARDAAQEVFVKVLGERKILKFRGDAQLWTWLYRVAVNTCKTRLLKRQKRLKVQGEVFITPWKEMTQLISASASPEEVCLGRQALDRLQQVMACLPKKYREIIRLIYLEEYSYREAAQKLRIPTSHLGVQLMRGKNMLSKLHQRVWPGYELN